MLSLCILVSFEGESLVIIHNIGIYLPIFCTFSSKCLCMLLGQLMKIDSILNQIHSPTYFRSNSCILQSEQQRFLYEICNSQVQLYASFKTTSTKRLTRFKQVYLCCVQKVASTMHAKGIRRRPLLPKQ